MEQAKEIGDDQLLLLWAKWEECTDGSSYHPLICHLIDVSMVMEALWEKVLPPAWKMHFAGNLTLSLAEAKTWLMFIAGLHDLGKACPGFQYQLQVPATRALMHERLRRLGLPHVGTSWVPHGQVSAIALRMILPEAYHIPSEAAEIIAAAVGGHHGIFTTQRDDSELKKRISSIGKTVWHETRKKIAELLALVIGLPDEVPQTCPIAQGMALAGAVSVADWIGSMEDFFKHEVQDARQVPTVDLKE